MLCILDWGFEGRGIFWIKCVGGNGLWRLIVDRIRFNTKAHRCGGAEGLWWEESFLWGVIIVACNSRSILTGHFEFWPNDRFAYNVTEFAFIFKLFTILQFTFWRYFELFVHITFLVKITFRTPKMLVQRQLLSKTCYFRDFQSSKTKYLPNTKIFYPITEKSWK